MTLTEMCSLAKRSARSANLRHARDGGATGGYASTYLQYGIIGLRVGTF